MCAVVLHPFRRSGIVKDVKGGMYYEKVQSKVILKKKECAG
jgi:hypothetical protein